MRIELTLRDESGSEHDVAITAPRGSTLGDLGAALYGRLGGREPGAPLWSGTRQVGSHTPLGAPALGDGAVLSAVPPDRRDAPHPALLALHIAGGPDAGRILPLRPGELTVGRGHGCAVRLADPDVSRHHLTVRVAPGRVIVRDEGSTNGTYLEGVRIGPAEVPLPPGAQLRLGRSALVLADGAEPPATVRPMPDGTVSVNRGPRSQVPPPAAEIEVPQRPRIGPAQRVQWLAALLPGVAAVVLAIVLQLPQFLLFGLLSPLLLLGTALGDRLHWRRHRRRAATSYRARLAEARRAIAAGLGAEEQARRGAEPDPAAVALIATTPSARLWERRRGDADLLRVRLGLGTRPSLLRARVGGVSEPAGLVHAVPVGADLRAGPLGIAAPVDVALGVARWLLCQLAALVSPADLHVALLTTPALADRWRWARWLPHLAPDRVATDEQAARRIVGELGAEIERRRSAARPPGGTWPGRWSVVVIDRAGEHGAIAGLREVLMHGASVGVAVICLAERPAGLPGGCATVAAARDETGTTLALGGGTEQPAELVADRVDRGWAERVARALAPLRDRAGTPGGSLGTHCRLLDLLGGHAASAARLAAHWRAADPAPRTVLGLGQDGPVTIDLARDGPHALVAGTTGSGKSELLRSLVAGLAAAQPPDRLCFVLIDYKGGAAFAECARLPHTAGFVTDLDPQLTTRALQSLECELKRREQLLAAAGAADLAEYLADHQAEHQAEHRAEHPATEPRSGTGPPIPRLVLVVDEFAALAEELPQFVSGLVGIAQRGRSLGVHLVLATQRPGGVVSAEIRANTALRIALRVTDPAESVDVIDSPRAAGIHRDTPGRALVRIGPALVEMQTADAGCAASGAQDTVAVTVLDAWRRSTGQVEDAAAPTELALLVERLREASRLRGAAGAPRPWLAPLPQRLTLAELTAAHPQRDAAVPIGLLDLPAQQVQRPMEIDLAAARSVLFAGGPRSGRSSALVTLALAAAAKRAPADLHVYGVDCAGGGLRPLAALAHCATLATAEDMDTVAALLRRLEQEVRQRAAHLAALGVSSVAEARAAGHDLPLLLCLLDGWDSFAALSAEHDGCRSGERLTTLLRAAPAAGLTVALTGDRGALAPRLSSAVDTKLLLRLTDPADYALAGVPERAVPRSMPAGRAVRAGDVAEVQLAGTGTRADQARAAESLSARWPPAAAGGSAPIRVRPLPASVLLDELPRAADRVTLGVGGDAAAPIQLDLFAGAGRLLVAGPARSGRSTALALVLLEGVRCADRVVVAAPARSPLAALARQHALRPLGPGAPPEQLGEPAGRTLLLVDDTEAFADTPLGDELCEWARARPAGLTVVAAGRSDELAVTYRGLGAEVRRERCGLLLCPEPVDGELLGAPVPRRRAVHRPGRGLLISDPAWGPVPADGPVPVQVALP